ncbi:ciliary microtubule associated protein 1A-like [Cydia pomonella]|uniref:ciliary microtubule associated protein 1A-like n=1 Tax=Cydia pomonella TaxID=82600 RepID=UPI002ADDFC21|nr:ciliary microtubule associated protein 1A-like [Cydia pomonella]XP_061709051.1 ciliary microtubule associated protein 1A-like [Cydia pomonella]
MPWGWECRAKLVKQLPAKPTKRRGPVSGEAAAPGPLKYEVPELYCGKGHGHIKRAPAYSFGLAIPANVIKPAARPNAPVFNVRGITKKGTSKIPGGVVGSQLEPVSDRTRKPGPGAYTPGNVRYKRAPAYTCQPPARPPYEPWDMWTCPPNMYCPYIPLKKPPAYSLGNAIRNLNAASIPGPGAHDPKFAYPQKNQPAYSFGHPFRPLPPPDYPPPNNYCEKKFMVQKRTAPAPSFGIRHTPYLGELPAQLKPSKLDLVVNTGS